VLTKGNATIEIRTKDWTGTPGELYEDNRQELEKVLTIVSVDPPTSRSDVAGMPAVEGSIHMKINGAGASGFIVVASDGSDGLVADLFGPLLDIQNLKGGVRTGAVLDQVHRC
jgi:hypothetical protein